MDRGRGAALAIEPADRSKSRRPQRARGRTSSWLFLSDRVEGLSRGTFDWALAIPCLDTRFNARTVFADFLSPVLSTILCILLALARSDTWTAQCERGQVAPTPPAHPHGGEYNAGRR